MNKKNCRFYCYQKTRTPAKINNKLSKVKLVVFDMDGVLADIISSWKFIHDYFKTSNEQSVDEYLQGLIDDKEFIRRDVALWMENGQSIKITKLKEILKDVPVMQGASQCVKSIEDHGVETAIVSAGLDVLADNIAEKLGIDFSYANGLKTDANGRLSGVGVIGVKLMYKDEAVKAISTETGIPLDCIASVGNSCFDIPMFNVSGLGIAFNPSDSCVCESADYIVKEKDLRKILPYLEKHI
jgi:phosphoserine phosphatase